MIEKSIVKLLIGISRLGETDLFGWWGSRALSEAGEYVLGSAFPRTWAWTALEGSLLSAARRHEESFSRKTAIHLFSDQLPAKRWALGWLREQKLERSTDGILAMLRQWDKESACQEISKWAAVEPPAGEILAERRRLGSVSRDDLQDPQQIERLIRYLAAAYVDRPEEFHFPYFDLR